MQQAGLPMSISAPMPMCTEGIEVPTLEVPTFAIAENDKALNDMGSKGRKLARDNLGSRHALQQAHINVYFSAWPVVQRNICWLPNREIYR